ncbi:MAG TPA: hypothetical protein VK772_06705 [Puia sp.]|jgi:hypothetical protein|nr:hypothetical protein [Puia sp.]
MEKNEVWNSLEIMKLVIGAVTPMLIAFFGLYLNKKLKKLEQIQWRNQKLIEKRLTIYDDLAPLLNDLYCYFNFIGNWKEVAPSDVVNMKRIIDKKVYLAAPLFSRPFFTECMVFINLCYETKFGMGQNAKLRTRFLGEKGRQRVFAGNWDNAWNDLFSTESEISNSEDIRVSYYKIRDIFSDEIGLNPYPPRVL